MGTSSSYGGPKGKNPLLPTGFEDEFSGSDTNDSQTTPPDTNDNQATTPDVQVNPETEKWRNAKSQISKLIKGTSGNTGGAVSSYVSALGGARKAAGTAYSGKSTTAKLGGLLSRVSSSGFRSTLDHYNIDYHERNIEEVLSDLVNKLAPSPDTKEDSIARNALLDVMEILYDKISENDGNLDLLDQLDKETFNEMMEAYISFYIYERLLSDLESRIEIYAQDSQSALDIEEKIKEYIKGNVKNKLNDKDFSEIDYNANSIQEIIEQIYSDCYEVIEGSI